jgi:Na+-translocating ferredoxin:NAD+ oxidoreductase subunit G
MKQSMMKNGLVLSAFAVVTTGLIALTYSGTEDVIELQHQQQLMSILNAIIPAASYDNDIQHDCALLSAPAFLGGNEPQRIFRASMKGEPVAVAIETTAPDGYSGKIHLVVGVDQNSQVSGVRVLEHKETPGLGDKIDLRISNWILGFNGKQLNDNNMALWKVRKDGGQFDQFTGATITPRAVVGAVKRAVNYYQLHRSEIFSATNHCAVSDSDDKGGS